MITELLELSQNFEYGRLLTESARIDYLMKTYGTKVADRAKTDPDATAFIQDVPEETIGSVIIQYIVDNDPSTNKQFSQWLVQRYIKNQFRLEDVERAAAYLDIFSKAKARLAKKDINQYASIQEVFVAIEPFLTGEQDVSKSAASKRMRSDENIDVICDDAEFLIVVPKNKEASVFWGKGTQWCTAASISLNHFDRYNARGPLYIIIDRKTDEKFQFHFESQQFMDYTDTEIDLTAFIKAHPRIVDILGRDKFAKVWKLIGLRFLTPEEIKFQDVTDVVAAIKTISDFKYIPNEMKLDDKFKSLLFSRFDLKNNNDLSKILDFYHKNDALSMDDLIKGTISRYVVFGLAPKDFHTDENKQELVRTFILTAHPSAIFVVKFVNVAIPKPWPRQIEQLYWDNYCQSEIADWQSTYNDYSSVPKEFRTPANAINMGRTLNTYELLNGGKYSVLELKEDAKPKVEALVSAVDNDILASLINNHFIFAAYVPKNRFDQRVSEATNDSFKRIIAHEDEKIGIRLGRNSSYAGYQVSEFLTKHIPVKVWNAENMEFIVKYSNNYEIISRMVEEQFTPETMMAYANKFSTKENLKKIPKEFWTTDFVIAFLSKNPFKTTEVPQFVITEDVLMHLPEDMSIYYPISGWAPKTSLTTEVCKHLIDQGILDFAAFPPQFLTIENVKKRYEVSKQRQNSFDISEIPAKYINPVTAIETVKFMNLGGAVLFFDKIPAKDYSPPLLEEYAIKFDTEVERNAYSSRTKSHDHYKKIFAKFPENMRTATSIAVAIDAGIVEPKLAQVPEGMLTAKITASILTKSLDEIDSVPADFLNEDTLADIAASNYKILIGLDKSKLTEKIVYSLINGNRYDLGNPELFKLVKSIPKTLYSQRICNILADNKHFTLKDIPKKFHTQELERTAVNANAFNIRYLDDSEAWIKKNADIFAKDRTHFMYKLEEAGFFVYGTGKNRTVVDVEDLSKTKLKNGYVVVKKFGVNMRLYIFDKKQKLLTYFYTDNGYVKLGTRFSLKNYIDLVAEAFNSMPEATNYKFDKLAEYNIFEANGHIVTFETAARKVTDFPGISATEWFETEGPTIQTSKYYSRKETQSSFRKYFFKNGSFVGSITYYYATGSYGSGGDMKFELDVQNYEPFVMNQGLVVDAITDHIPLSSARLSGYDMTRIGLVQKRSGDILTLNYKPISKSKKMSIWLSNDKQHVSVFGEKGLIMYAKIRNDGGIYGPNTIAYVNDQENEYIELLTNAAKKIKKTK